MKTTRREFLGGLPKTALKLSLASQSLTGLANLIFADEDYLSKLPPLNGRKVTEELIEEMLNIGSVRGILEKYGNKENVFYVEFSRDGGNNLDDLVKKEPEKWDGSYVLACDNSKNRAQESLGFSLLGVSLIEAVLLSLLSYTKPKLRFVFYNLEEDINIKVVNSRYHGESNHLFTRLSIKKMFPKIVYSKAGDIQDVCCNVLTGNTYEALYSSFCNRKIWTEHIIEGLWLDENGKKVSFRYDLGPCLKKEVKGDNK